MVTSESQWGLDQVEKIVPGKPKRKLEYGVFPSYYDVRWEPDASQPRFVFVGGLNRLKGIDLLIEMLRRHWEHYNCFAVHRQVRCNALQTDGNAL